MPLREYCCAEHSCEEYARAIEHWYRTSDPDPECEGCGQKMALMISTFAVAFSGGITAKYNDKTRESPHKEGHWMVARNTPDGKPKWEWIDTWQKKRAFMRQEKLTDDVGNIQGTSDGRTNGNQGRGVPGCWV